MPAMGFIIIANGFSKEIKMKIKKKSQKKSKKNTKTQKNNLKIAKVNYV